MRSLFRVLIALVYLAAVTTAQAGALLNSYTFVVAGGAAPTIVFTDESNDTANASSYSFTTQALGTAGATRYIHVSAVGRTTAGADITDINVGASDCPLISPNLATADNDFATCIVAFPSGTTDTIVVTTNANMSRLAITVHAIYDLVSTTPTDRATATGDPSTTTAVDFPANGVGVAIAATGATGTTTWSGLTEGVGCDAVSESATNYTCAQDAFAGASSGPTISADFTGGNTGAGMIVEAFN